MIRQLAGALVRELKRELSTRGIREFTFGVSQFGPYRFRCGNRIEYMRTVGLGGEAAALGAFLFLLRPDDCVWDIGASVGLFSVHAAGVAKDVVAFEPDPATFKRLRQNVELNRMAGRVTCRMEALGDETGEATLWTNGLAGSAPSLADRGRHDAATNVPITTVDHLLDLKTPLPTVLKIDVEGAEMLVLRGAGRLLASDNAPRLIFLEVHPRFLPRFGGTQEGVQALISEHGYEILARRARKDAVHLIATRS